MQTEGAKGRAVADDRVVVPVGQGVRAAIAKGVEIGATVEAVMEVDRDRPLEVEVTPTVTIVGLPKVDLGALVQMFDLSAGVHLAAEV